MKPLMLQPTFTVPEQKALLDVIERLYPDHQHSRLNEANSKSDVLEYTNEGRLIDSAIAELRRATAAPPKPRHDRAKRGSKALDAVNRAHLYETRNNAGDEQFITDLLTDLMHLCYSVNVSFDGLVHAADEHFEAELAREDDDEEGDDK